MSSPPVERVRGALALRQLQPVVGQVHAHDPLGALQAAARHGAEADQAGAEHHARRALLDLGGVDRRAEPGREAAGERRRVRGRGVGADHRQRDLGHHGVLGERGRAHEVAHLLAAAAEAGGAVGQVALVLLLADGDAEVGLGAHAVDALAALGREQRDHAVALLHQRHALAQLLHDAAALVAEHRGRVARRVGAGRRVHVGVADAAGLEAHQHLARLGLRQVHLLHREWLAELLENRRFHPHGRRYSTTSPWRMVFSVTTRGSVNWSR